MKTQRRSSFKSSRIRSGLRSAGRRFSLPELLEARMMLSGSVFTVKNTNDSGADSLRAAILALNADSDPTATDSIVFALPMGSTTISLSSALPNITHLVTIDGLDTTNVTRVQLDGSGAGAGANGLTVDAAGVILKNLSIGGFAGAGVVLEAAGGDTLSGDYIGVDVTGANAVPNGTGVSILSGNNLVTGSVISGNIADGVDVAGDHNTLAANLIGTDSTGEVALGNGNVGVLVDSATNTLIGGATSDQRNIISGNTREGVIFTNDTAGPNELGGNYIGIDKTGLQPLGNGATGVNVGTLDRLAVSNLLIDHNVISANGGDGIDIWASSSVTVRGNWIGTDGTGHAGPYDSDPLVLEFIFGNQGDGVLFAAGSTGNTIGGAGTAGNVLSGNYGSGVTSGSGQGTNNTVQGNLLGIDIAHGSDGNAGNGVTVHTGNLLVTGNTIATNFGDGVDLLDLANDGGFAVLTGNFIGTDASSTLGLGNDGNGVFVLGTNNVIGGTTIGAGNVIAGNLANGIDLESNGNSVFGNWIGTDSTRTAQLPNSDDGVLINGSGNQIGGTGPGAGNVIAFNSLAGVFVSSGQNNAIRGNSMFSNVELGIGLGDEVVPLPNNSPALDPMMNPEPNFNQNYPVINTVTGTSATTLTVTGTMQGTPNTTYLLDFYSNTSKDDSGYGEGETYVGSLTSVTTDVNGNATFSATFSNVPATQTYWSATATDPMGNTSEFALDAASVVTAPQKSATTTTIASSLNPSTFGQKVTFTATVSPAGGTAALTGTITFTADNMVFTVPVDPTTDSASWTVSLPGGSFAVQASYSGDANYVGSGNMLTQVMNRASTTTSLASSLNPSTFGQAVTFTATVTGQSGTSTIPTGTVTFMANGSPIGSATLGSNGVATLTTSALMVGTDSITVMYNSDANYASSAASLTQVVNASAGTISGHTYFDVTGNGLSADDKLMGGITVKLFQDKNNNGTLDSGDGAAIKTVVSDNNGAYAFGGLTPGKYFVQEVTPSGYVRTAPTLSTFYTDVISSGTVIASNDFDNYQTGCCCNSLTNVKYIVDNKYCYTDLRGHIHQGDTVQVTFTVLSGHTDLLSLVSYTAPGSSFDANDASQQQVYQAVSGVFGPGTHSMTVVVPQCYFQIDFVCGSVINQFGPAGSNIFYSAEDRLISADNGGYVPPPSH